MKALKTGCFISAKTDSSRLPRKLLKNIHGKTVIEHVIQRAKLIKGVDEIVLCTTLRPEDDILEQISSQCRIKCYRGETEDRLARWLGATKIYGIDCFVTFDGDDLFCDPELMELALRHIVESELDFIKAPADIVCGGFTSCIATPALIRVCEIKGTRETEIPWVYFTDTGIFKWAELDVEPIFRGGHVRLTLDYPEDLEFFKKIFDELETDNNSMPLREILAVIDKKPELARINLFRQEEFIRNQKNKIKLILKNGEAKII